MLLWRTILPVNRVRSSAKCVSISFCQSWHVSSLQPCRLKAHMLHCLAGNYPAASTEARLSKRATPGRSKPVATVAPAAFSNNALKSSPAMSDQQSRVPTDFHQPFRWLPKSVKNLISFKSMMAVAVVPRHSKWLSIPQAESNSIAITEPHPASAK